ncbi:hypothetical protein HYH02_013903 [Chlamydomonas schloesseri]|uniref:Guanylate cyclase domain-containing protein n=1 Tax=Chlamydomonas schloesseri TaxID=2026947 RepID=A0A835SMK3_9CHLO|nr:hypothetical protein HYH02_013903 [Chlamydomonas schloesseri]|eukprot:KAG2429952.1 hypothetical protein HYH02_013903 [Chlamydomonas schloesseri]
MGRLRERALLAGLLLLWPWSAAATLALRQLLATNVNSTCASALVESLTLPNATAYFTEATINSTALHEHLLTLVDAVLNSDKRCTEGSSSLELTWAQYPSWVNGAFTEWILNLKTDASTARYLASVTFNGPQELPPPSAMGLGPEASRSGAYSSVPASSSSSSLYNSSSAGGSASTSTGVVDPSVLRDYAALTNPLVVVYSSDLSGFDMSFAVEQKGVGEYPENACVDLANPRGPLHPRAQLLMFYRADVLAALAAGGALESAAPPADWEGLEALLASHAAAEAMGPGAIPGLAEPLPPHGLCVTMHTTCGRGGDVLAAIAASVVQTAGTAQGYVFDLDGTPAGTAGSELVAGPGWRHAAAVLQRLLVHNAPEGNATATSSASGSAAAGAADTSTNATATGGSGAGAGSGTGGSTSSGGNSGRVDSSVQELCRAMSRHFLEGRCLVTLDWDVLLLSALAKTPWLMQPGVLGVAPLPGSRVVLERGSSSSSASTTSASSSNSTAARLVPCTQRLCRVSANHDRLYLTPEGQRPEVLAAAAAANGTCVVGDNARVEAAALAASTARPSNDTVLINRAPYSVMYDYFVYINYERVALANLGQEMALVQLNVAGRLSSERKSRQDGLDGLRASRKAPALAAANASASSAGLQQPALGMGATANRSASSSSSSTTTTTTTTATTSTGGNVAGGWNGRAWARVPWWAPLGDAAALSAGAAPFTAAGVPQEVTEAYLRAMLHAIHSPNAAPDVQSPGLVNWYKWALSYTAASLLPVDAATAVAAARGASPDAAAAALGAAWELLAAAHTPAAVRRDYAASIGQAATTTDGSDTTGTGSNSGNSPGSGSGGGSSSKQQLSTSGVVALVGGIVGGIVAAAVLLVLLTRRRRHNRNLLGRVLAPRAGPDTTMLITDIQNSTTLWEALDVAVMDETLKLHHDIIRRLLAQHDGYESATEGDSFLVAFADPASAVAFATACQLALLKAPWPEELLCHPDAAPVVVDPTDEDNRDAAQRVGLPSGPDRPLAPAAPGSSFLARLAAPALYLSSRLRVAAARSQAAREWAAQGATPSGRWWAGPHGMHGMGQVVPVGGVGGAATPGGTILPPPYSLHATVMPGMMIGGGPMMYDYGSDVSVRAGSHYGAGSGANTNGPTTANGTTTPFGTGAVAALYGTSVTGAAAAAAFRPGGGRVHSEAHLAALMHMTGGHVPQGPPLLGPGAGLGPAAIMGMGGVPNGFNGNVNGGSGGLSLPGSSMGSFTAGPPGAVGLMGAMGVLGGGRMPSVTMGKGPVGVSRFRQASVTAGAGHLNAPGRGGSNNETGGAPVIAPPGRDARGSGGGGGGREGDANAGSNSGGVEDLERVSGDGHMSQDCGSGSTGTTAVTTTTAPDGALGRGVTNFGGGGSGIQPGAPFADGMGADGLDVLSVRTVAGIPERGVSGDAGGNAAAATGDGRSDSFLAAVKVAGSPLPVGGGGGGVGKVSGSGQLLPSPMAPGNSHSHSGQLMTATLPRDGSQNYNRLNGTGLALRAESMTAAALRLQRASGGGFMPGGGGGGATPPPAAAAGLPALHSPGGIFGEWRWSRNGSIAGTGTGTGLGPIPSFFGRRAPGEAPPSPLPFFWGGGGGGGGNSTVGGGSTLPGAATTASGAAPSATASSWWEAELRRVFPVVPPELVPGSVRSGYQLKSLRVLLSSGRLGLVAYRGVRVRMGLHTGLEGNNFIAFNKVDSSYKYSGPFAETAKCATTSAPGGMVVLSASAFARLRNSLQKKDGSSQSVVGARGSLVLYAGHHVLQAAPPEASTAAVASKSAAAALFGTGAGAGGNANAAIATGPVPVSLQSALMRSTNASRRQTVQLNLTPTSLLPDDGPAPSGAAAAAAPKASGNSGTTSQRQSAGGLLGGFSLKRLISAHTGGGGNRSGRERPSNGAVGGGTFRGSSTGGFRATVGGMIVTSTVAPGEELALYQAVPQSLVCRLALSPPLRSVRLSQVGSLGAPTGCVTVAFMYVVGASTLLNDLPGPAARALDLFQRLVCKQLLQTRPPPRRRSDISTLLGLTSAALSTTNLAAAIAPSKAASGVDAAAEGGGDGGAGGAPAGADGAGGAAAAAAEPPPPPDAWSGLPPLCSRAGYLVEGGEGLVLAVFRDPTAAVEWALDCVEALKKQDWEDELLAHWLCEEVLSVGVTGGGNQPVTMELSLPPLDETEPGAALAAAGAGADGGSARPPGAVGDNPDPNATGLNQGGGAEAKKPAPWANGRSRRGGLAMGTSVGAGAGGGGGAGPVGEGMETGLSVAFPPDAETAGKAHSIKCKGSSADSDDADGDDATESDSADDDSGNQARRGPSRPISAARPVSAMRPRSAAFAPALEPSGGAGAGPGLGLPRTLSRKPSMARMGARAMTQRVLERGLRIKVGIDMGRASHTLTEASGRLSYRGKVMNRASRVAGKAAPGQVLITEEAWRVVLEAPENKASSSDEDEDEDEGVEALTSGGGAGGESEGGALSVAASSRASCKPPQKGGLVGVSLGKVVLRGVSQPVELIQCMRGRG